MEGQVNEFLETTHDKFVFRVRVGYFYSKDDFWARVDGNTARIGVSDFLQKAKGDVAFLEVAEVGTEVKQGQELGKIETIKATFGILSPVSGRVADVNLELDSSSYLINEDPYEAGWIYKIELKDFASDKASLLMARGYLELMEQKIAEEMKKK
jgi:glycine cleavage system H protein